MGVENSDKGNQGDGTGRVTRNNRQSQVQKQETGEIQ